MKKNKLLILSLVIILILSAFGCRHGESEEPEYLPDSENAEVFNLTDGYYGDLSVKFDFADFEYGTCTEYNRYTRPQPEARSASWHVRWWKDLTPKYEGYEPNAELEELEYGSTSDWATPELGHSNYWTIYPSANGDSVGRVISDFMTYIPRNPAYEPDYTWNTYENTIDLSDYDDLSITFKSTHSSGKNINYQLYMYDRGSQKFHLLKDCTVKSGEFVEHRIDLNAIPKEERKEIDCFRFEFPVSLGKDETIRNDIYGIQGFYDETPKHSLEIAGRNIDSEYLGSMLFMPFGAYSASGFYDTADGKWKVWFGASTPEILAADNVWYIETDCIKNGWSKPYRVKMNDPDGILFAPDENPGYGGDPSVIKVNGTYYMYFSGLKKGEPADHLGSIFWNQVFLATSTDGKNWDLRNEPVISAPTSGDHLAYGAGGPSVVYLDGVFYMYYFTTTSLPGEGGLTGLLRKTSSDGIHFSDPVPIPNNYGGCDVKFLPDSGLWIMTYENNGVRIALSEDGINFNYGDAAEQLPAQENKRPLNHNMGFIGTELGHGFNNMFLTYGSNDLPLGPTGSNMDSRQLLWSRIHLDI